VHAHSIAALAVALDVKKPINPAKTIQEERGARRRLITYKGKRR
jgi:hypothetical protein